MMGNFLNSMFGKIENGMCKLSMDGNIAIKTSNGYKTYDVKKGTLTNCDNFVMSMGNMDAYFLIPTNKVVVGDIILVGGKPRCVTKVEKNSITCINYENSTIETIVPEKHMFMGNTYFYGKIVSMFGNLKKGGANKIFKYMMMSEMMGGHNGNNNMNSMLPMMLMMNSGGFENMFEGIFDDIEEEEDNNKEDK